MAKMNRDDIRDWMQTRMAADLGVPPEEVSTEETFDRLGLDSLAILGVLGELAGELDIEVETTVLFDHPSIEALATHLATVG